VTEGELNENSTPEPSEAGAPGTGDAGGNGSASGDGGTVKKDPIKAAAEKAAAKLAASGKRPLPTRALGPPRDALRPVERRVTRTLGDKLKRINERNTEVAKDSRVAIYVMVLVIIMIVASLFLVFYPIAELFGVKEPDPLDNVDIKSFVKGDAKVLEDGRLELFYDFEPRPVPEKHPDPEHFDRYPELDDWAYENGIDKYTGFLRDAATTFVTFEGPITVELDFEVLRGHSLQVDVHFTIDGSSFRCSVVPSTLTRNLEEIPGKLILAHYKQGVHQPLGDEVEVDVERRTVHHLKFEITDQHARAWIDDKLVQEVKNPYFEHYFGKVRLKGWNSRPAFDNVRITARPSADWIRAKLKIQRALSGEKEKAKPTPEQPKPVTTLPE